MMAWLLIAGSQVLMAARRSLTLFDVVVSGTENSVNLSAEILALCISIMMLLSILLIRPLIRSFSQSKQDLRTSEKIYRDILDNMTETYYRTDSEGRIVMASPSAEKLLGFPVNGLAGQRLAQFYAEPAKRDIFLAVLYEEGRVEEYETWLRHNDGHQVLVETNARIILNEEGTIAGVEGIVRDVTARRATEQTNLRFGRIIENSANEIYVFEKDSFKFNLVNRGARENLDYSSEELSSMVPSDIKPDYSFEQFKQLVQPLLDGTEEMISFKTRHQRKDGSTYPISIDLQLTRTETPQLFFAVVEDLSEKVAVEERLSHAHKMEAVGQLTGGIAHDFNNLLTVIIGNIELALEHLKLPASVIEQLLAAFESAEKGALLTQRLLSFSRKQSLKPQVIDLRVLIRSMNTLLERTLREDIKIENVLADQLWRCQVDPTQLENAILNLSLNAQDAMPDGGKLTFETSNVFLDEDFSRAPFETVAGEYVLLAISDTGIGMSAETRSQAFDPFFTTKSDGKGSGLGLSMVYGFVKQSGGNIDVYSEPNEGTTIEIYLPRAHDEIAVEVKGDDSLVRLDGEGRSVLVVEDNPEVIKVVDAMLRSLNFAPRHVTDVQGAIECLQNEGAVDILITDVILPGAGNGNDLVAVVKERWPDIAVLYMSGYTENALIHEGRLAEDVHLLSKPFTKSQLESSLSGILRR